MTEHNQCPRGGGTAPHGRSANPQGALPDHTTPAAWLVLELNLAAYLATMTDPGEGDHLVLRVDTGESTSEAPCHSGTPYAQFAGFGDGQMLRAEVSGYHVLAPAWDLSEQDVAIMELEGWQGNDLEEPNWYLMDRIECASSLAARVVEALRDRFGLTHPSLLTHQAWGPAAEATDVTAALGLLPTGGVPTESTDSLRATAPPPTAQVAAQPASPTGEWLDVDVVAVGDRDDLIFEVRRILQAATGAPVPVDDDGDLVVQLGSHVFWVRVHAEPLAIELFDIVVHSIHSRRATSVELGLLNRDHLLVRWTLQDRRVFQRATILGNPFSADHLTQTLTAFVAAYGGRSDLALRTGGQVAQ